MSSSARGCTRASTMPAPRIRPAWRSSAASPISKAAARPSPSRPAWPRSRPRSNASTTARISSPSTISMAARGACSSACAGARPASRSAMLDLTDAGAIEAAIRPNTRLIWIETPTNPLLKLVDLERVAADRQESAASGPPPTTPSPAPMCRGRSNTASTWSCIPPRNISTAIPTWSAAWRSSATMQSCATS